MKCCKSYKRIHLFLIFSLKGGRDLVLYDQMSLQTSDVANFSYFFKKKPCWTK